MKVVSTSPNSDMQDKIDDLRSRQDQAINAGNPRSVERQHEKGKLLARERLEYLLDRFFS